MERYKLGDMVLSSHCTIEFGISSMIMLHKISERTKGRLVSGRQCEYPAHFSYYHLYVSYLFVSHHFIILYLKHTSCHSCYNKQVLIIMNVAAYWSQTTAFHSPSRYHNCRWQYIEKNNNYPYQLNHCQLYLMELSINNDQNRLLFRWVIFISTFSLKCGMQLFCMW
jgi:hypothetical protein